MSDSQQFPLNQNLVDNVEDILSSSSLKLSLFPPWVLLQENVNFTEQPQLKITNFSKRNYEYPCKHLVKNLAFVLPSSLA